MKIVTQLLLIFATLGILYVGLSGRRTHLGRAWKKIGLCILVLAMIVAIAFPDLTTELANSVGIGRGADLLLYGLTLAFVAFSINSYLQQQNERDMTYRLARKVALLDANERYKVNKKQ